MNDVTREDFNGLGGRVNLLTSDFGACRAARGIQIDNLLEDVNESKRHIDALYNLNREEMRKQSKIMGAGIAAVTIIQVVGVLVMILFRVKGG
jgi:hypothetical protein